MLLLDSTSVIYYKFKFNQENNQNNNKNNIWYNILNKNIYYDSAIFKINLTVKNIVLQCSKVYRYATP